MTVHSLDDSCGPDRAHAWAQTGNGMVVAGLSYALLCGHRQNLQMQKISITPGRDVIACSLALGVSCRSRGASSVIW